MSETSRPGLNLGRARQDVEVVCTVLLLVRTACRIDLGTHIAIRGDINGANALGASLGGGH